MSKHMCQNTIPYNQQSLGVGGGTIKSPAMITVPLTVAPTVVLEFTTNIDNVEPVVMKLRPMTQKEREIV